MRTTKVARLAAGLAVLASMCATGSAAAVGRSPAPRPAAVRATEARATGISPAEHCPGGTYCTWSVTSAADGGIYWRSEPDWNTPVQTPGTGVYPGDSVYLFCYAWGSAVAPYGNTLWYFAENDSRGGTQGWVNDHFLDTPGTAANPQPQTGECNGY